MNGRDARTRGTATQSTGRLGGRRGSGVWLAAVLLPLLVFLCLIATAVASAASASATPLRHGIDGSALASPTARGAAPRIPTAIAPEGITTPLRPTLMWSEVKGARSYDLRIYWGGSLKRVFNGWRGTTRRVTKALPTDLTLTFRVRARNVRRAGAWSKGIKFVITSPTPESPLGAGPSSTFRWRALRGADTYDLSVSGDGVQLSHSGVATLWYTFAQDLPTNVPLTWRVRGRSGQRRGAWSSPVPFTVVPLAAPATPSFDPAAGAVAWGSGVTISSAGADAIYYTTDGSTPTRSSTDQATTPLVVDAAVTVKALAVKAGADDSAVGVAAYTQAASADLSALALSGSPSGYSFAAGTYAYSGVSVLNGVSSITVTPTGSGVISVQGVAVDSGSASDPITLTAGTPKTITVVATQAGKSAKTYALTVTRNSSLVIGQGYGGGVVAYIANPGAPASEQSGLIAATTDQSTGIQWASLAYQSDLVSGSGTALGTGSANTTRIVLQNGGGSTYAAGLARAYNGGGYNDWYLPSKDELDALYQNRTAIGGFTATWYWSSSQGNPVLAWNLAWFKDFSDDTQGQVGKDSTFRVRAVRSFPADSAKAISAFSFQGLSPVATGTVNDPAHTIAVTVPYGTDVTHLAASFTTSGAVVAVGSTPQTSGTTANDFSDPVTYTVTAADASTQNYTVTVTENSSLVIGQGYGGGVVAYILQDGDLGYDAGVTHGLIAATADQDSGSGIRWAVVVSDVSGASGTAIGTGLANTNAIIAQNGAGISYAAGLARAYTNPDTGTGEYSDWYLPSKEELHMLYVNRDAIGEFNTTSAYWSSSWFEWDTGFAWSQAFDVFGYRRGSYESDALRVRAVRAF